MRTIEAHVDGQPCIGYFPETQEDLREFMVWVIDRANAGDIVAVDSETTGLAVFVPGFRVRLVQFGHGREGWLIPVEFGPAFEGVARRAMRRLPRMIIHNAAFDLLVFDHALDLPLEELHPKVIDTRILAHLFDSRPDYEGGQGTALKPLAVALVDPQASDGQKELIAEFHKIGKTKDTGWAHIDIRNPVYLRYALLDVVLLGPVYEALLGQLAELGVRQALVDFDHEQMLIGATVERTAMYLDVPYTEELIGTLGAEEAKYSAVARQYGVTSVNAPKQVGDALLGMGETLTERTESGQLAVGKEILLPMADLDKDWFRIGAREPNPFADAVLRAKRAGKWSKSYAQAMLGARDERGRVHPHINTMGARTARWAVSGPPLQQLPSSDWTIRRCIVAEPGNVIGASDLAQVELRVLVALAGAGRLVEAVNAGRDLHTFVTRMVYALAEEAVSDAALKDDKRRKTTKVISLGKAYAGGKVTLARQTGLPLEQVEQALRQYDRALPEIRRFSRRLTNEAFANRMTVVTPSGRTLRLNRDKAYTAIAYLCQSTARDILGQALVDAREAGILPYIVGVVHDEVLIEAPEREAPEVLRTLAECMRMPFYGINIETDPEIYGPTWGHGYAKKGAAAEAIARTMREAA